MAGFPRGRRWVESLLHTHESPRRTAAAFAVGVLFGFSPFLGLHTVLGVAAAFALGLNRVAVLLGVYSNLPWVVVPYYTLATWIGAEILGVGVPSGGLGLVVSGLQNRSWRELGEAAGAFKPLLWAFTLGSTIGACLLAAAAYRLSLAVLTAHRTPQAIEP